MVIDVLGTRRFNKLDAVIEARDGNDRGVEVKVLWRHNRGDLVDVCLPILCQLFTLDCSQVVNSRAALHTQEAQVLRVLQHGVIGECRYDHLGRKVESGVVIGDEPNEGDKGLGMSVRAQRR